MTDDDLLEVLKEFCQDLAEEDIEVMIILKSDDMTRIAGTLCPVCALEEMKNYIEKENIKHITGLVH